MVLRRAALALSFIVSSIGTACVFDATVPVDAATGLPQIACASIDECPPAFVCSSNRCLPEDLPRALDAQITTDEDESSDVVLEGDRDPLRFAIVDEPRGTLSLEGDDATYTPLDDDNGQDSFRFVVTDGVVTSLPATVLIDIT